MNDDFFATKLASGAAVLAPMAGFTDAPFRKLCREFGSAWAVTEMVSAKALLLDPRQGVEIGKPYPGEPDLVIQLFGSDPQPVAAAAHLLYQRYQPAALDLNLGCPVRKITRRGSGSSLMRDPERCGRIVAAMAAAVPVPISAKMRLGFDAVNALEVATSVAEAGASAVAIHGRTARQKYQEQANWEAIAETALNLDIPVIGSGDVISKEQFERQRARGLGVMIGRGCLGRPWIFSIVRGGSEPSLADIARLAFRHAVMRCLWYGKKRGIIGFRRQLLHYFDAAPQAAELRQRLRLVNTLDELKELLEGTFTLAVDGRSVSEGESSITSPKRSKQALE